MELKHMRTCSLYPVLCYIHKVDVILRQLHSYLCCSYWLKSRSAQISHCMNHFLVDSKVYQKKIKNPVRSMIFVQDTQEPTAAFDSLISNCHLNNTQLLLLYKSLCNAADPCFIRWDTHTVTFLLRREIVFKTFLFFWGELKRESSKTAALRCRTRHLWSLFSRKPESH